MTVTARRVDAEVQLSVRDTGIGIAAAEQTRVFEAFQRGGRAARTSTEGTGLGLTLSKRIIDLHGGRLWMESEPGVGSTFSFAIPVVPASAPPRRPARRAARAGRREGRRHGQRPGRGGRPAFRRSAARLPRGRRLRRVDRSRRRRRTRAGGAAPPGRGDPRHPAAAAQRLGSARAAQGRSRDGGDPRRDRLDDRRPGRRVRAGRDRLPRQAGRSRASARRDVALRVAAAASSARWWRSTTTRWIWTSSRRCSRPRAGAWSGPRAARKVCEWSGRSARPSWCSTC